MPIVIHSPIALTLMTWASVIASSSAPLSPGRWRPGWAPGLFNAKRDHTSVGYESYIPTSRVAKNFMFAPHSTPAVEFDWVSGMSSYNPLRSKRMLSIEQP
jgi:hypothetical protein